MTQAIIQRRPVPTVSSTPFSHLHPVLARVYAARGVESLADIGRHLNELLPDHLMKGMGAAVDRLVLALERQERILILGDFDCDGATSTTLAVLALRMMGAAQVDYLVPNRFEFGYGLSPEIVEVARQKKPDVIVTVDNGISSIEGVKKAQDFGIDVIVTDHHLPGQVLPDAVAIVNPNQPGCDFIAKSTCGVGVIFYVMIALRRALQSKGYFSGHQSAPNLANLLDLVALGTVADVVALEHNNRTLVHQGLLRIRAGQARPGILALLEVAGRQREHLMAADLGFAIAPRLNAAGRLEDMSIGIECLLTDNPDHARELAQTLNHLNVERRGIEQSMQKQAIEILDQLSLDDPSMPWGVCLFEASWHQGVIGILASRIKDRLHRPVIAFALGDEGEIKGSARSIPGFHIRDGLDAIAARHPGLLKKFGGHAAAAGLSISIKDLAIFKDAFNAEVKKALTEADLQRVLMTDGELQHDDFTLELSDALQQAGPWGHQFPEPVFDGYFKILQQRIVGQKHLKLVVMPVGGQQAIDAIAFGVDTQQWPNDAVQSIRMVYRLARNEFRGQVSLQLMVDYLEAS
ncbi:MULTISPECIES: single-stranded-DNA-specific exonuclease RecJ [Nitrincola]|uniref:Single-stranded-DNA-specific exonuclease RecJ n=1 Tax=Nitrincola nitratireducens TaxID=1229521 RepID=W9V010_9GAMM|nr:MULTISPECIES: single-stranded-DNA-specific exonuclease RecJ [Nitrincola]EXJ09452.1 Single-stranded-DNA-specific exonuclease recJ [Nitrincola nitratireducens]